MNYVLVVVTAIAVFAGWLAYVSITNTYYVPFVGSVQYFCSKSGTEYLFLPNSKSLAPHLSPSGLPVTC